MFHTEVLGKKCPGLFEEGERRAGLVTGQGESAAGVQHPGDFHHAGLLVPLRVRDCSFCIVERTLFNQDVGGQDVPGNEVTPPP